MPATEHMQSNLPAVTVGSNLPKTINLALSINRNNIKTPLGITIGDTFEPSTQKTKVLIAIGEYYAFRLTQVLEVLAAYHPTAISTVMSILEPYLEATQELDLHMPPISSRRVAVNVTDRGRAKPDLYIE